MRGTEQSLGPVCSTGEERIRGGRRRSSHSLVVFVNLFRQPLGAPMKPGAVEELFGALSRRGGLSRRVTLHMLRHAAGSAMSDAGVGIDVVQSVLGHVSILSTQLYLHPNDDRMRDAVERLAQREGARRSRPATESRDR